MCGFVVSVARHGRIDRDRLARASGALAHRGPDAAGTAFLTLDGEAGSAIGLAHRRLSIIDVDHRSDQPFRIGRHVLVYNGELYNYRDLSRGMPVGTEGDTEILLRLLMQGGPAALEAANGMWAYGWLDEEARRLTFGRDRYGKKPLFYTFDGENLHLASEPRALAELIGRDLALRPDAADAYLAEGWLFPDPSGATHFDGIQEVPPGWSLTLDLATWTLVGRKAHDLPTVAETGTALGAETLAELMADAVRARLVSDRRVGLFLSGGVDSTLILSILHRLGLAEGVVCITDAGRTDDARYAKACIEQLGIKALNLPLPYDRLGFDQFLAICRAQAKPFPMIGNVLGMHALYQEVAAHDIRVVLDGTGADEIFGGYWHRYFAAALRDAPRRRRRGLDRGGRAQHAEQLPPSPCQERLQPDARDPGAVGPRAADTGGAPARDGDGAARSAVRSSGHAGGGAQDRFDGGSHAGMALAERSATPWRPASRTAAPSSTTASPPGSTRPTAPSSAGPGTSGSCARSSSASRRCRRRSGATSKASAGLSTISSATISTRRWR